MTETHTLRPDFVLLVAPQDLAYWNLPDHIDKLDSIETVWLLDRNLHVHACELTPSYELWPIETRAVLKDEFADDDQMREEIDEIIRANDEGEVKYVHVREIDRILAGPKTRSKVLGDFNGRFSPEPYEETSYDEHRDKSIEYCRCNQQI